jgi:hypothetical protein
MMSYNRKQKSYFERMSCVRRRNRLVCWRLEAVDDERIVRVMRRQQPHSCRSMPNTVHQVISLKNDRSEKKKEKILVEDRPARLLYLETLYCHTKSTPLK